MSKGLGKMQKAIMSALEPAKAAHAAGYLNYTGGEYQHSTYDRPPKIRMHGHWFFPKADIFDVRSVLRYMAERDGVGRQYGLGGYDIPGAYAAAFSRAIRSLIKRKLLEHVSPGYSREIRLVRLLTAAPDTPDLMLKDAAWRAEKDRYDRELMARLQR